MLQLDTIKSVRGLRDATVLLEYHDYEKRPFSKQDRIYYNALVAEIRRFVATLKQE
jgi:hypothetical protein